MTDTKTITDLNAVLAIEHAMFDSYEFGIEKVGDPYVRQQLEECKRSHQMRIDILREEVEDLDGEPTEQRDEVGAIDKGKIFGEDSAIAALERAEDAVLAKLRQAVEGCDFDVRDLIEGDLLPEAERSHAIMVSLKAEH